MEWRENTWILKAKTSLFMHQRSVWIELQFLVSSPLSLFFSLSLTSHCEWWKQLSSTQKNKQKKMEKSFCWMFDFPHMFHSFLFETEVIVEKPIKLWWNTFRPSYQTSDLNGGEEQWVELNTEQIFCFLSLRKKNANVFRFWFSCLYFQIKCFKSFPPSLKWEAWTRWS